MDVGYVKPTFADVGLAEVSIWIALCNSQFVRIGVKRARILPVHGIIARAYKKELQPELFELFFLFLSLLFESSIFVVLLSLSI